MWRLMLHSVMDSRLRGNDGLGFIRVHPWLIKPFFTYSFPSCVQTEMRAGLPERLLQA